VCVCVCVWLGMSDVWRWHLFGIVDMADSSCRCPTVV